VGAHPIGSQAGVSLRSVIVVSNMRATVLGI
jgi:hypothetical protein